MIIIIISIFNFPDWTKLIQLEETPLETIAKIYLKLMPEQEVATWL